MGDRKAATAEVLKWVEKLLPGSPNTKMYEETLNAMSNTEFDSYMKKLESGEEIISIISPNLSDNSISIERNFKIAEELGHDFFQRLWLTDARTGTVYLTPIKYLVIDLPLRRQQQLLVKKTSIPENNRQADELTGQATGPSKGSSLSFPETQVLFAQGFDRVIEEFIKFRGGDTVAFQSMNKSIVDTGGASQDAIKKRPSRVKSTETLSVLLKGMHLDNNL